MFVNWELWAGVRQYCQTWCFYAKWHFFFYKTGRFFVFFLEKRQKGSSCTKTHFFPFISELALFSKILADSL
jgi:hypothetical protein